MADNRQTKKKRTYRRTCGFCNCKDEQSNMIRLPESPNGWTCFMCYEQYIGNYKFHLTLPDEFY